MDILTLNLKIDISVLKYSISIQKIISSQKWYLNSEFFLKSKIHISIPKIIDSILRVFSTSIIYNESLL